MLSGFKLKPKPYGIWLLKSTRTAADSSSLMNFSAWWQLDHHKTNRENKFIKYLLPSTAEGLVTLLWKIYVKLPNNWVRFKTTMSSKKWLKGLTLIRMVLFPKRNSIICSLRKHIDLICVAIYVIRYFSYYLTKFRSTMLN